MSAMHSSLADVARDLFHDVMTEDEAVALHGHFTSVESDLAQAVETLDEIAKILPSRMLRKTRRDVERARRTIETITACTTPL